MTYEIHSGTPTSGKCEIRAYDESWELMASYHGYYDWRARAWKLYPLRRYALPQVAFKKLTLSERDVHLPKPKMERKSVGADSISARSEKKAEPKAWWTLPEPDGQMKMV